MLEQLNKAANDVAVKMNLSKTKTISKTEKNIKIADKVMSLKLEKKTKQRR